MIDRDNDLPTTWTWITFKNAVENISTNNKKIKQKDYLALGKFPIVDQGQSLIGGYTNDDSKVIFSQRPLIIFGDHTKILKFISQNFAPGADGVKVLAPQKFFEPKLFLYFTQYIVSSMVDNGYARHYQHLEKCSIPLPPVNEQKRIIAKIEELFSEIDKGLENLQKAQELLKAYRQSILESAATGELLVSLGLLKTPFDDSYKTELSKVISDYGQGWSPKCLNESSTNENDWAVIKTTAIQNNEFLQNENKLLPTHLKPKFHLEIAPGDILITRAGPRNRVGIACLVRKCRKHLILCDKAYRIKVNEEFLLPEYLEMLLNSPHVVDSVESLKTGINDSGVNLTQERFLALRLVIPPLSLQELSLQKLQEAMSTANHLNQQINIALEKIKIMRQSILKKAFSGELVPQDPKDEPTNIFLERMKSEQLNHCNHQIKSKKRQKVAI